MYAFSVCKPVLCTDNTLNCDRHEYALIEFGAVIFGEVTDRQHRCAKDYPFQLNPGNDLIIIIFKHYHLTQITFAKFYIQYPSISDLKPKYYFFACLASCLFRSLLKRNPF